MDRGMSAVVTARARMNAAVYPGGIPGLLAGAVLTAAAGSAWAGPEGEQVVQGQATFQRQGDLTVIHAGNNSVINYRSFDIAAHEKVQFVQPDALSRVLNRIDSAAPTRIDGMLSANGRVYIVNPAGVMFGKGAVIDVARLFAAGGNLADADFLKHVDRFTDLKGAVVNNGSISADAVSLLGASVANHGTIVAERGAVMMAAGDEVFVGEQGGHLYAKIKSDGAAAARAGTGAGATPGVENTGTVRARRVSMSSGDLYSVAIRNKGSVKAAKIDVEGGKGGLVEVGGRLDASSAAAGAAGGEVRVLGERVVVNSAVIDASGAAGGGTVLVGGSVQGRGPERAAQTTIVTPGSEIRADATAPGGGGGTVAVWSEGATGFYGSISAQGASGGAGGFVETSGKGVLDMRGTVRAGNGGTWLLDPRNVTIDNVGSSSGGAFGGGNPDTFTPTADDAVVDSSEINSSLNSGTSVIITTSDATGTQDGNVIQTAAGTIDKTVPNAASFTILASGTITLNGGINTSPANKAMNVTLTANDAAQAGQDPAPAAGDVVLNAAVNTRGGTFSSTGVGFTSATAGTVSTLGGSLTINHTGPVSIGGALSSGVGAIAVSATDPGSTIALSATVATTSGNVTFNSAGTTTVTSAGDLATTIGSVTFGDLLAGPLTTAGDITTSGGNVAFNRPVTLTGPVAIGTNAGVGSGTVTFSGTVDGAHNLSVVSGTAATTFAGAVGSLTPVGSGVGAAIALGGTTGPVSFESTVATASGIVSTGASTVTFKDDVTAGNGDTASSFVGDVVLDGLTFSAADGARFGDAPGADRVTLSGGPVALSSSGGAFTFDSAVDGAQNLSVNSGAAATAFNGVVGGVTPIGTGTGPAITLATSGGTTTFAGTVAAAGPVTAAGPVVLRGDVTVTGSGISTFDGNVMLDGLAFSAPGLRLGAVGGSNTVTLSGGPVSLTTTALGVQVEASMDGAENLTVNAATGADFKRAVGAGTPIGTGTGTAIDISGGASRFRGTVRTAGPVVSAVGLEFRDDVTIGGTGTSTIDGDVTFDKAGLLTFSAPSARLGTTAGSDTLTVLNGPLTLTMTAGVLAVEADVTGAQDLTADASGGAAFKRAVSVGDGTGAALTVGTGGATFDAAVVAAGGIALNGATEFKSTVGASAPIVASSPTIFRDDVTVTGAGVTRFDGDVTLDGLTFMAPAVRFGAVGGSDTLTLSGGDVAVSTSVTGIQVEADVTGAQDLVVNGATGATFARTVSIGDGAGDSVTVNGGGGTFTGAVTAAGGIAISAATEFKSTVGAAAPFTATGPVVFRDDVAVTGSGVSVFDGDVTLDGLAFSAPGLRLGAVGGTNTVTLSGGPVSLTTTALGLQVEASVNGAQNLAVSTATGADFKRGVGAATPIGTGTGTALDISGGDARFRGTVRPAGPLASSVALEFRDDVTIGGTGTSTIDGDVTFDKAGLLTFSAPSARLGTTAGSDTLTMLSGPVSLTTATGALTVEADVTGAQDLTVDASGGAAFKRAVSVGDGTGASLTLLGAGATFESTLTTLSRVSAASPVEFRDNVTIGGAGVSVFDDDVTFSNASGLSFTAPGVRFGALGGTNTMTLAAGPVTLTSTVLGLQIESDVDGAQNLTVSPATLADFKRPVGSATPIGTGAGGSTALTIGGGGALFRSTLATSERVIASSFAEFRGATTIGGAGASSLNANVVINNAVVSAAGGLTIGDSGSDQLTLQGAGVTIGTTNAALVFNSRVDGAAALTTGSGTASTTFNAAVGSATPTTGLAATVAGPGAFTANSTISSTGAVTLAGTGDKTLKGAVTANAGFTSNGGVFNNTGAPITTIGGPISIGHAGAVMLGGALSSGAGNITIGSDIQTTQTAPVTTTTGNISYGPTRTGGLVISANSTSAGGTITMNRAVTLAGPVTFSSAAGGGAAISFGSTVNGPFDLTVDSGAAGASFAGAVGGVTPLGDGVGAAITLLSTGPTVFSSALSAASGVSAVGPVTLRDTVSLGDGDFRTDLAGGVVLDGLTFTAADGARFGDDPSSDAVVLSGGPVSMVSTNSTFTFLAPVDGAQNLTIDSGTATSLFNAAVGATTPIGTGSGPALTLNSTGTTTFASTLATASGIDAAGPAAFIGDVALGDGDTATTLRGDVTLGRLGGMTFLASDGAVFGDAAADQVTITGGAVTILSTPGNGPLTFNAKVDSDVSAPEALEIDAGSGAVRLGGTAPVGGLGAPIGSVRPLASLRITGNPITITADVTTIGAQEYIGGMALGGTLSSGSAFDFPGPVTLLADTTIRSGSDVTFRQTVATDGAAGAPRALTVETTGAQSTLGFQGAVGDGAGAALASLTTLNPGGVTTFGGGLVTTTGAQDYTGRVLLETGMTYTGSSVRFGGAVASTSPPVPLSVSAIGGAAVFDGPVGDTTGGLLPLSGVTVQSASTAINGGAVRTAGDQQFNSPVVIGADTTLDSSGGGISFGSTLDGAHELTISARNGTTTFGGDVGGVSPLGTGSTDSPVVVDSTIAFTGAGAQLFRSTDGARLGTASLNHIVTFGAGGLTIDSSAGGGPVAVEVPVNGAGPLSVNAGSGAVSMTGIIGGLTSPASLSITGGSIGLETVTTAGPQTYNGPTTLGGNLVATGPGAIAINGSAAMLEDIGIQTLGASASDSVTIAGGVQAQTPQSAPNLSINAGAGAVALGGTVGPTVALAPGNIAVVGSTISLPAVTSLGTQTYTGATTLGGDIAAAGLTTFNGPATLAASVIVGASNSPVSFLGTLTGPHDLTVNASGINLGGDVSLGDGDTSTPIRLNGAVAFIAAPGQTFTSTDGAAFGAGGANQGIQLSGGPVTVTSGAGGGSFSFNGPVNGAAPLTVNAGAGSAIFAAAAGAVTPLSSLEVTAGAIDVVGVSTAGPQSYNGAVNFRGTYSATGTSGTITMAGPGTLAGDAALVTGGGAVSFNSTLDGRHDLVINSGAGAVMFGGAIGAGVPLGDGLGNSITLNSSGPAEFLGTVNTGAGISAFGSVAFREDVSTGNGDNVPSLFRGETTLDGLTFTAADGVIFAGEVLMGGSATSVMGTQPDTGRVIFRRGLNAMPGTAPDVMISSAVVRVPDGAGSASPAVLSQPAIQLGPVGLAAPLGSLTLGGDLAVVPKEATILFGNDRNGDGVIQNGEINESDTFEINTTGDFIMGQNQKATALGNLTVNAGGDVALSDMNSLGSININAGAGREIRLLKRDRTPGGIYDTTGSSSEQLSSDLGLDFVAAGDINFSVAPTGVSPTEVDFATNSGNRGQGMEQFPVRIFSDGVSRRLVVAGGSDSSAAAVLSLDLRAQGPTETNIASALAGALPRTDEGPEPYAAAISESLKAKLEQMGIFVKEMRLDEVIEFLVGRTVYRDVPQRTRPESGDYRISARRLPADSVEQVVSKYLLLRDKAALDETGAPITDEKGNPLMVEQWENIRDTFATAWSEFIQEAGGEAGGPSPDGAAFRAWLESRYGADMAASQEEGAKALGYLEQLRDLFNGLESMGLSPQEVKFPKNKIIGDVTPPDMDAAEMERAISGRAAAPEPLSLNAGR
ncbi:MAG: filamentous hemagglutinin N-terminal domain-containing protein [Phycisphaerales bacterium]|nr:filamentous hemagglutinin N-terminal domain-containing protein [Phycisphaerales bacterium]